MNIKRFLGILTILTFLYFIVVNYLFYFLLNVSTIYYLSYVKISFIYFVTYILLIILPISIFFSLKSKKKYIMFFYFGFLIFHLGGQYYDNYTMYSTRDDLELVIIRNEYFNLKDSFKEECVYEQKRDEINVCRCINYDYEKEKFVETRMKNVSSYDEYIKKFRIDCSFNVSKSVQCYPSGIDLDEEYANFYDNFYIEVNTFCKNYYINNFGEESLKDLKRKKAMYTTVVYFNVLLPFFAGSM